MLGRCFFFNRLEGLATYPIELLIEAREEGVGVTHHVDHALALKIIEISRQAPDVSIDVALDPSHVVEDLRLNLLEILADAVQVSR
jgi:hypothetical protein